MDKEFWLERWEKGEIAFHQGELNPYLQAHWPALSVARGSTVFVPLCSKSLDMLWLRQQGHPVLGVELSSIAVEAFFRENGLAHTRVGRGKLEECVADDIRILCGDFFDLRKEDLKDVRAVYDRASLIALPPEMRQRYAHHLLSILPPGTRILLLTFDYEQAEMSGPPFAVSPAEVEALYGDGAEVRLLERIDALAANPRFGERGLTRLHENIFLLTLA